MPSLLAYQLSSLLVAQLALWNCSPHIFSSSFGLTSSDMLSLGNQVDVWSAGILFYQMLFGRRPFGHDQTQERILREDTIIKARKVDFPSRPAVSNEAKVSYAH